MTRYRRSFCRSTSAENVVVQHIVHSLMRLEAASLCEIELDAGVGCQVWFKLNQHRRKLSMDPWHAVEILTLVARSMRRSCPVTELVTR